MSLIEKKIDSQILTKGGFLEVRRDSVRLPDGEVSKREYVVHGGAVLIIPILPDGQLVLEKQYRYPVQETMIEFPAGRLEAGEESFSCAQRELLEETGYIAKKWAFVGKINPCIGYSSEIIDIWLATELEAGKPRLDAGEFVEVFTATPETVFTLGLEGNLKDGKTLAALNWVRAYLDEKWVPAEWVAGTLKR